jgi:hypothetical protein
LALAFALAALCACGAGAAELPSRAGKSKPPEAKTRTCEIGGEQGVALANGTCFKIGGYVDVGVSSGNIRH